MFRLLLTTAGLGASLVSGAAIHARETGILSVYTYQTATPTTTIMPSVTVSCPTGVQTATSDCPPGCVAGYLAGALGVDVSKFSCYSDPPETVWATFSNTSTCSVGSTVHTWTLWGGQTELGCKTASSTAVTALTA